METESVMPKARMKLSQPDGPLCGAYAPATLPGVSPGLPPALDGEGVGVKACALATATLVSFPNLNFITKSEEAGKSFLTLQRRPNQRAGSRVIISPLGIHKRG